MRSYVPNLAYIWLVNIIVLVALIVFASGFFPYKPLLPGLAQLEKPEGRQLPRAPFDKVVFMVIDALRSDFVYSNTSGFTFTQGLISNGYAMPFTANAQAPTVTMPRVKALTTGSIPSFIDIILNFAESDRSSTLSNQDTWLAQIKAQNRGNLVMYGDDTWLKLFPDLFTRADGTSSFFVSDFTEVDNNVTRHVPDELQKQDWAVMVMHYLGMDHIGHKSGPQSVNMFPKQREMDNIVKQIYSAIDSEKHLQSTLLVLCGDHGMNEGGNHGGSAPGETSPALLFASPILKKLRNEFECPTKASSDFDFYRVIEQADVVPTLAGLLGLPTPLNNLGIFIHQFLPLWSYEDQAQLLLRNARQMLDLVKATFPHKMYEHDHVLLDCDSPSSASDELACAWKDVQETAEGMSNTWTIQEMEKPLLQASFLKMAQKSLSRLASNYNVLRLQTGIMIGLFAVAIGVRLVPYSETYVQESRSTVPFLTCTVSYAAMMFASSYVEEEQQFWYWVHSGWLLYEWVTITPSSFLTSSALLLLSRMLRRWNQSGQKYAGAPDIARSFLPRNSLVMLSLVVIAFGQIYRNLMASAYKSAGLSVVRARLLAGTLVALVFSFKAVFSLNEAPEIWGSWAQPLLEISQQGPGLIGLAQLAFTAIGISLVASISLQVKQTAEETSNNARTPQKTQQNRSKQDSVIERQKTKLDTILTHLTLALVMQSRSENIPLLLLCVQQSALLPNLALSPTATTFTILLNAYASYFAAGGTNSISSIDLSNAYNGVSSYNIVAVGFLLFIGNWAGPIYWSVVGVKLAVAGCAEDSSDEGPYSKTRETVKERVWAAWKRHVALLTLFFAVGTTGVMGACLFLRTHLFVWTVFSPKFLYQAAWVVGWHGFVNLSIGWVLMLICGL